MANKEKSKTTVQVTESAKPRASSELEHDCPLCSSNQTEVIHRDSHSKIDREYCRCAHCDLVFVPTQYHLPPEQEKAIYDCHENSPNDPAYRKFLSKLAKPLQSLLKPGANGLDFGSGPGPTLSVMLREQGFNVSEYDPFYSPDQAVLSEHYDFITSTEVIEHLSQPKLIFEQLFELLDEQGVLGIMSKRPPVAGIRNWHYTKDPTHISFYSEKTFSYIAERFKCQLKIISSDTVLLIRSSIS